MRTSVLTEAQALRLAQFRVKKGVRWLNQHAPVGWQWNMFSMVDGGKVYFRAKDAYDNECVLALAFTNETAYASPWGYVTFASAARHRHLDSQFLDSHGFHGTTGVPGKILDIAWQEALVTYAKPSSLIHRHSTASDRAFAKIPHIISWGKWWRSKVA
jgi:hypothetical protein